MNMHWLSPGVVHAAEDWGDCVVNDAATFKCLEPIFTNLVGAILSLSGVALFVMFLVGGFGFLFSGGDPKKLEQSRGTLSNAVIGLVVIVAAYLILRIISSFTGVTSITTFEIPTQ
jgi:hypothetical protein